jgi:NAD-dependent DNA ligase
MTNLEKYNQAKEAYYNGTPIMSDIEFDELERSLGLENKGFIGARHNPSYTIQHPYIMGSLSKVQIKNSEDGGVDWDKFFQEVSTYIYRYHADTSVIVTPKYDGCSFEAVISNGEIESISSRGDGNWGKDIKQHLIRKFNKLHTSCKFEKYTLRGEVLIDKNVFTEKYSDFVNPRSFVSGLLNRDYDAFDDELNSMLDDLSIVIYDLRYLNNGSWVDLDWNDYNIELADTPSYYQIYPKLNVETFEHIYNGFAKYREMCPFALDGIVIKPVAGNRISDLSEVRPKDCVAVKFIPMLQETEVIDIEWNTGKTNELRPVIIVKPVYMDGKKITRASAHNYGYLVDNKVSIGSKVILSLAGDIIPFIYKVTNTDNYNINNINLPNINTEQVGCHLYKKLSDLEKTQLKFIESVDALNIPSLGPAAAKTIFEYVENECKGDEFFGIEAKPVPNNILFVTSTDIDKALGGKTGTNAKKSFNELLKNISIADIIVSCTFESCGRKVAEQIQQQLLFGNGNFEHMAEKAYRWCFDNQSHEYQQVVNIMNFIGKSFDDYKEVILENVQNSADQIPVILTGEPNDYKTKADFLLHHPEYRVTGSWKEVQIVFTNDLQSRTGKMKKAIEKNIEIRLY